ncbi:MAG: DUF3108 domain-containing protein [Candidatus Polarisedimenticolaceae bacterium]|nr:DUF3108 domain-containing protein [Candidatus Polarisedimenticolaceae bacterium]
MPLLSPACLSAAPQVGDRLEYTISYQGGLTAMAWLDICDAVLESSWQPVTVNGEAAYKAEIKISSEPHKKMEALYPFRYQLTSYFSTDLQRSILFERRKKTRKERHEIIRFDWDEKTTERYKRRKPQQAEAGFSGEVTEMFHFLGYAAADFRRSGKAGQKLLSNMLDRLSLLQAVRGQNFAVGDEMRFTIADGKKVLNYLVRVQTRGSLEQDNQQRDLFKVRFDAFTSGEWSGQPVHPAVFVWMTADERKIPVRFVIDYAMGNFVIQLKQGAQGQMAKTSPLVQRSPAH